MNDFASLLEKPAVPRESKRRRGAGRKKDDSVDASAKDNDPFSKYGGTSLDVSEVGPHRKRRGTQRKDVLDAKKDELEDPLALSNTATPKKRIRKARPPPAPSAEAAAARLAAEEVKSSEDAGEPRNSKESTVAKAQGDEDGEPGNGNESTILKAPGNEDVPDYERLFGSSDGDEHPTLDIDHDEIWTDDAPTSKVNRPVDTSMAASNVEVRCTPEVDNTSECGNVSRGNEDVEESNAAASSPRGVDCQACHAYQDEVVRLKTLNASQAEELTKKEEALTTTKSRLAESLQELTQAGKQFQSLEMQMKALQKSAVDSQDVDDQVCALRKQLQENRAATDSIQQENGTLQKQLEGALQEAEGLCKNLANSKELHEREMRELRAQLAEVKNSMQGNSSEVDFVTMTDDVLRCALDGHWSRYEPYTAEDMTCFEPEARGHLVTGRDFHRFYFPQAQKMPSSVPHRNELPTRSSMVSPVVRLLGPGAAVVSYVRLVQTAKETDGVPVGGPTKATEETRVWQFVDDRWQIVHFHRSNIE